MITTGRDQSDLLRGRCTYGEDENGTKIRHNVLDPAARLLFKALVLGHNGVLRAGPDRKWSKMPELFYLDLSPYDSVWDLAWLDADDVFADDMHFCSLQTHEFGPQLGGAFSFMEGWGQRIRDAPHVDDEQPVIYDYYAQEEYLPRVPMKKSVASVSGAGEAADAGAVVGGGSAQ